MTPSALPSTPTPIPVVAARRAKSNGSASAVHSPLNLADKKGFASFHVPQTLLERAGVCRVTSIQATNLGFRLTSDADLSGVFFPYCDDSGNIHNGRIRRDHPEFDSHGNPENKYISLPHGNRRLLFRPPDTAQFLKDTAMEVLLVEAEKSALAITAAAQRAKRKVMALATGGCYGWREQCGAGSVPLKDLDILRGRRVGLLFDANVVSNPQVQQAELELSLHLSSALGVTASCYRLPVERGVNGPDDFLAKHSDADFWKLLQRPAEPWLTEVGEPYQKYATAKPPEFVIENFLQSEGLTIIAGLSGHGKTWILLSMVQSLLASKKLFGSFRITEPARRVIYLSPEITLGSFRARAEKFGLGPSIKSQQLLVRTLSAYPILALTDPALLLSVRGADVFLDTAVRFMEGDESSSTDNDRGLAAGVFRLFQAGARSVTAAHHSAKAFEKQDYMCLENALRGTGDIGAMAATVWAVRMLDPANTQLHVQNVKARDFSPPPQFQLLGRPHIDEGKGMQMSLRPGECGPLSQYHKKESRAGRKPSEKRVERQTLLVEAVKTGQTREQIEVMLKEKGFEIADTTLTKEIRQARSAAKAKY